jgi:hypothetical protein
MREIAGAFANSNLQPFEAIDDKVVCKSSNSVEGFFRFKDEYRNRAGVLEVTSKISSSYQIHRFAPKEIVSSGDTVWGLFDVEADYGPANKKAVPKPLRFEYAIRWPRQNKKIVEHQTILDTAGLLAQQGELGEP